MSRNRTGRRGLNSCAWGKLRKVLTTEVASTCHRYCFGAPHVCNELAGSTVTAGAFAHPAFLREHHSRNMESQSSSVHHWLLTDTLQNHYSSHALKSTIPSAPKIVTKRSICYETMARHTRCSSSRALRMALRSEAI